MAEALTKVRLQLIDPNTGAVVEDVDVKSASSAISHGEGTVESALNTLSENVTTHTGNADIHLDTAKSGNILTGVTYEKETGKLTFSRYGESVQDVVVDTLLEKLAVNFALNEEKTKLVVTLDDGTTQEVDLSSFIDVYTAGTDTEGIVTLSIVDGVITPSIADGSITKKKLATEVIDYIDQKADSAKYTLPVASSTTLGGVKIGSGLSVSEDGTISASGIKSGTEYATASVVSLFLKKEA